MSWNENATLCKTCKVTYYGNCSQSFNASAARLINLLRASLEFLFEMIVLVTECTMENRNVRKPIGGCFSNQPFLRVLSATSLKDHPVTLSGPSQTHGLRRFSRSRLALCALFSVQALKANQSGISHLLAAFYRKPRMFNGPVSSSVK